MSYETYCRIMDITGRLSVHGFRVCVQPECRSNNGRLIAARFRMGERGKATQRVVNALYKRARLAHPAATWR